MNTGSRGGKMLDKYIYNFLHWIMGWSGKLNAWAWRKHVKIIETKREKEDQEYLDELKKKAVKKSR